MASLCHPWFTTTKLSYRFPIFETSATALCGTTGIWWYTMIYDGIWWYMMVYDGVWWYTMVYDGIWWYMMVYYDIWWYTMIYDGIWWYMMVYNDIWWYMMIYDGIWWCMMIYDGIWWYMMVYYDKWYNYDDNYDHRLPCVGWTPQNMRLSENRAPFPAPNVGLLPMLAQNQHRFGGMITDLKSTSVTSVTSDIVGLLLN